MLEQTDRLPRAAVADHEQEKLVNVRGTQCGSIPFEVSIGG